MAPMSKWSSRPTRQCRKDRSLRCQHLPKLQFVKAQMSTCSNVRVFERSMLWMFACANVPIFKCSHFEGSNASMSDWPNLQMFNLVKIHRLKTSMLSVFQSTVQQFLRQSDNTRLFVPNRQRSPRRRAFIFLLPLLASLMTNIFTQMANLHELMSSRRVLDRKATWMGSCSRTLARTSASLTRDHTCQHWQRRTARFAHSGLE